MNCFPGASGKKRLSITVGLEKSLGLKTVASPHSAKPGFWGPVRVPVPSLHPTQTRTGRAASAQTKSHDRRWREYCIRSSIEGYIDETTKIGEASIRLPGGP